MEEIWKDVPGYEGYYQASTLGRVRSLDRETIDKNGVKYNRNGRILKQGKAGDGRLYVILSNGKIQKMYKPHILVAQVFIGDRPSNYIVAHNNGDYTDNRVSNLRYDTIHQNSIDCYRYGRKAPNGKLSIEQVTEIRNLFNTKNYSLEDLAKQYNVHLNTIDNIITRKTFYYVNDDGTIDDSNTAVS